MAAAYEVGPPRVEEAPELGRLHVAVWRHAYRSLMAPRLLQELDEAERAEQWRQAAATAGTGEAAGTGDAGTVRALVARDGGRPIGMIVVGPPRDLEPPAPLQLWSLNVHPDHHGRGAAQALVAAALPDGAAYLWVLRGNDRAIAFYTRLGFVLDGVSQHDPAYDVVELRMTRGPVVRAGGVGPDPG